VLAQVEAALVFAEAGPVWLWVNQGERKLEEALALTVLQTREEGGECRAGKKWQLRERTSWAEQQGRAREEGTA